MRYGTIGGEDVSGCPEVSNWGNALGRPMAASWQPKYHTYSYRWEEVEARGHFGRRGRLTPTARLPSERQQTRETNLADHQHLQNAAAALAASAMATLPRQKITPEKGVQLYFQYLDALMAEDNKRKMQGA